jgi:aspartate-semialdehyde dehydrogenase
MSNPNESIAAIVGGDTLIGREVGELLTDTGLATDVRLISSAPEGMNLVIGDTEDDAAVLAPLAADSLTGVDVVFLAGGIDSSRKALELAGASPGIVDLTSALEDSPRARLRAPVVEPDSGDIPTDAIHVVAHPAAIALAMFYARIVPRYPIERAVVEIFEPASGRGQRGVTELQNQTVNLLSFKPLPKEVYDTQVGFNMLSEYGAEAPDALSGVEYRIERHLATLLANSGASPMPSLRVIQAPVFHGYSLSIWMEFENNPGPDALRAALAGDTVEVRADGEEAPDNVGIAGQGGIAIGNIRSDRNNARACWFWLVADNLRLQAENAIMVAQEFL